MLIGAVNPYEFHARSIGVYAALTVCDRVVTALPTGGSVDLGDLRPEDVPRTLETARAWGWSSSLWRAGVVVPAWEGRSSLDDVEGLCNEIARDDAWSSLRRLVEPRLHESTRARVEAISRDLAHGGINPGVSVPVSCAIARFAARAGLVQFRSPARSVVTKLEDAGTTRLVRCALPVMEGIDGATLLALRETLDDELSRVRVALIETCETARSAGVQDDDLREAERTLLHPACEELERAFAEHRRVLADRAEDEGARYRLRSVTITLGHADPDAGLRAAAQAAARVERRPVAPAVGPEVGGLGLRALTVCSVAVRKLAPAGV